MATSIRDLIRALENEAPYASTGAGGSRDAAHALGELGRALRRLASDGLDLEPHNARENLVIDLAESCAENSRGIEPARDGRLGTFAGALADVVGVLSEQAGRDQRWAIALELANSVRVLSAYAADGDGRRTAELAWVHLTARALVARALHDAATVHGRAVLDRAIPSPTLRPDLPAARTAMDSLTVISNRLRRSAQEMTPRPTLLEVFAVTRAAESTSRYAATAEAVLAGRPPRDALPAAAIWFEIRDRLRPFTTANPLNLEIHDLGIWAHRAHTELRREFGTPDTLQISTGGAMKIDAVQCLQTMTNELPTIADHLSTAVEHMADHRELHALASKLPYREDRLTEFLNHRAVAADRFDIHAVIDRLADASTLAAELAVTLDRTTTRTATPTTRRHQSDLIAAHQARIDSARMDPHASLVENVYAEPQLAVEHHSIDLRTDIEDAGDDRDMEQRFA